MPAVDVNRIAIRSRYQRTGDARPPAGGLERRKANRNVPTVTAAVVDPWGNGHARIQATVNRRTDLLENELAHGRISEAAYAAGTRIQEEVGRAASVGGSFWAGMERVDATSDHEHHIGNAVENARRVRALADAVARVVGVIDMRLLRRILGDRLSFEACAALEGKGGERGTRYVACRFRDALEELATAWASKGPRAPTPDDRHARRAAEVTAARFDPSGET